MRMKNKKGLNIELTDLQYEYLYDLVMFAYEMDTPDQKGWDIQTFDNLVDNVCNAKETYLGEDIKGIWRNLHQSKLLKLYGELIHLRQQKIIHVAHIPILRLGVTVKTLAQQFNHSVQKWFILKK